MSIREAASKLYVGEKFIDPCIIENTAHIDFIERILDNVHLVKVISMQAVGQHLRAKNYVD